MNDEPKDEAAEAAAGLEANEAARELSRDVVDAMEAVVASIVRESLRPGAAITALRIASRVFREAAMKYADLDAEEVEVAEAAADSMLADPEVLDAGMQAVAMELHHKNREADTTTRDIAQAVGEAAAVLSFVRSRGHHPITVLVILFLAQRLGQVLLERHDPDNYEENRVIVRAMENVLRRLQIDYAVIGEDTVLSKGGQA